MFHSRFPRRFSDWLERALDSVLPAHCVLCGQGCDGNNLCAPCRADLPRVARCCPVCALPLAISSEPVCGRCLSRRPPWDRAVAALLYRYPADQLVLRYKFNRDFASGKVLAAELVAAVKAQESARPELLVPVPLHRRRHLARMFNQADLLARSLGKALGIPVCSALLVRRRNTPAQSGLDAAGRRRNIRGAFGVDPKRRPRVAGLRVAVVDDVLTTGATLAECTRLLRRAGAAGISIWVAARA